MHVNNKFFLQATQPHFLVKGYHYASLYLCGPQRQNNCFPAYEIGKTTF